MSDIHVTKRFFVQCQNKNCTFEDTCYFQDAAIESAKAHIDEWNGIERGWPNFTHEVEIVEQTIVTRDR